MKQQYGMKHLILLLYFITQLKCKKTYWKSLEFFLLHPPCITITENLIQLLIALHMFCGLAYFVQQDMFEYNLPNNWIQAGYDP